MPRKAKDEEVIEKTTKKISTTEKKAASTAKKAASAKKDATAKKTTSTVKETAAVKKDTSTAKKAAAVKKDTSTAKKAAKTTTAKKTTTKRVTKTSSAKRTTSRKSTKKVAVPVEYYDLPTAYDKTVVKILAQTPSCLFVYWEISKKDKLKFQNQYGEGFFQDTKPYLVIINETMNYSFETEINDYANSWYIHIHDSDCKYTVKLIRKPINHEVHIAAQFIDIVSSNEIDAPNDHILFDRLGKTVFFRNVKTNIVNEKDISSLSFISNIGRIYNIYDLYKEIYKTNLDGDELGIKLSSSQFSSFFK